MVSVEVPESVKMLWTKHRKTDSEEVFASQSVTTKKVIKEIHRHRFTINLFAILTENNSCFLHVPNQINERQLK